VLELLEVEEDLVELDIAVVDFLVEMGLTLEVVAEQEVLVEVALVGLEEQE
jgi:hypothetical protein